MSISATSSSDALSYLQSLLQTAGNLAGNTAGVGPVGDWLAAAGNSGSQASGAIDFFETSWSGEQWTRGCPVGIPSQGTLLAYGSQIRQPVGRIHWAGTETSTYWNGYMDGAVRSGERAAAEALSEL